MSKTKLWTTTRLSVVGWNIQLVISCIGAIGLITSNPDALVLWCLAATGYFCAGVIGLGLYARSDPRARMPWSQMPQWLGRAREAIVIFLTLVPVAMGVYMAINVIVFRNSELGSMIKVLGVWAMLLAWIFLHWGFAQLYAFRADEAAPERILEFPGVSGPTVIDYIYFSTTVGTSFAASDVNVLTPRTRWLVTVHSVLGFFINALIIALSFNTIMAAS